ncbi:hypothetical protein QE152_g23427 [Popillia japonica]|uniref:Uncharacterized protein n=1 Tax=Popillia japonica TaxID=7064 RepID=A0AAW1KIG6_POPJA
MDQDICILCHPDALIQLFQHLRKNILASEEIKAHTTILGFVTGSLGSSKNCCLQLDQDICILCHPDALIQLFQHLRKNILASEEIKAHTTILGFVTGSLGSSKNCCL